MHVSKKKKDKHQTADLLAEVSTLDEVRVRLVGSQDIDTGLVPKWCEVVLEIKRTDDGTLNPAWPINAKLPLRRHDGELIIESLHHVLHPRAGGAVAEGLWLDLDAVMDRLMSEPSKVDKGLAAGLTIALARLSNPFQPDEDLIKSIAVERWEARQV